MEGVRRLRYDYRHKEIVFYSPLLRYRCLDLFFFFEAGTMVVRFKEIPKTAELKASGFSNGTSPELMAGVFEEIGHDLGSMDVVASVKR
jgi:hypothetical protein